jgi:hypothetical protein
LVPGLLALGLLLFPRAAPGGILLRDPLRRGRRLGLRPPFLLLVFELAESFGEVVLGVAVT